MRKAYFLKTCLTRLFNNADSKHNNFSSGFKFFSILLLVLLTSGNSWAGTKYFGGTGTWTGSVWSATGSAPFTTAWVTGDAAVFNIASSTITGASTAFSGITANESVTVSAGGTITTGGTVATITVASGKTFNFGSQAISTAAGTGFIKEGAGILSLAGGTYPGGFTLNSGMVVVGGVNALGTGALTINGGTLAASATRDLTGKYTGGITIGGDFTLGSGTTPAVATSNITFTNNIALGGATRTITIGGTGTYSLGGIISNGGLTINNSASGNITLTGVNTYTGSTTLNGGIFRLNPSANTSNLTPYVLNGGTLSTTGIAVNRTITASTIQLTNSSTIVLGTAVHTLTFAESNGVSWTANKNIIINGWTGTAGVSGTAGKIFVGNSNTGLTVDQLAKIYFTGYKGTAMILSTGELVPSSATAPTMSGTYRVGTTEVSPNFTSLRDAIIALNSSDVIGNVLFEISSNTTEPFNIAMGVNTNTYTVTIKPAAGVSPTITFSDGISTTDIDGHFIIGSPSGLNANLAATNNIIIDGSNTVDGTTKDMTILGPVTTNQRSVIRIYGNNDNITIKNCIITNRSTSGSTTAAINVTNYFNVSNFSPDNLTIQNNTLNSVDGNGSAGINVANSGSATVGITGLVIRDNIVFGRQRGMLISYTNDGNILGNAISEISQAAGQLSAAISLQTNFGTAGTFNVYNNKITTLTTLNTTVGDFGVIGIDNQCVTPKIVNIYNNTISGMKAGAASTTNSKLYAIRTTATSTCNIYQNTIYMPEGVDMSAFGSSYIAGIVFASTAEAAPSAGIVNVKNNIIISDETGMKTWGIRRVGTAGTFTSDNNNIYRSNATNGFVGFFNASDASDIGAWRTASSQDANSKSVAVNFVNTATGDLSLTGGSISDINLAVPQLATVNADITGASRYVITYAGAYESTRLPAYFQSKATGNWDAVGTWQVSATNNTPWVNPVQAPTNNASAVSLENGYEVTVNANATSSGLTVQAGGKLSINPTYTLAVTGNLSIESNASTTGTIKDKGTLTVSGTSTVKQDLSSVRNWYISSPVSAADRNMLPAGTLWKYNELNTGVTASPGTPLWDYISTNEALEVTRGYILKPSAAGLLSFTGTLNTDDQSITVLRTENGKAGRGFNLIGNPYPSFIDIDNLALNADLEPTIWIKSYNSGYVFDTYNIPSGLTTGLSGLAVTKNVAPMQAFWVRVASGKTSATVNFLNDNRGHQDNVNNTFRAPATQTINQVLRLKVEGGSRLDEAVVYFNANAANIYDRYDSPKMLNGSASTAPDMYTMVGEEQLVINGLKDIPYNTEIPLYFKANASTATSYTLVANEISNFDAGTAVYIKNKLTGEQQIISDGSVYTFASSAVGSDPAFSLIIKAPGSTTGLNKTDNADILVYVNTGNQITVVTKSVENGKIAVYNSVGQQLASKNTNGNVTVLKEAFTPGVYVVKVNNVSRKVIVK